MRNRKMFLGFAKMLSMTILLGILIFAGMACSKDNGNTNNTENPNGNGDNNSPYAKLAEGLYKINGGNQALIQVSDSDPNSDTFVADAIAWINTNSDGISTSIAEYVLVLDKKTYNTAGSVNELTKEYTILTIYGKQNTVIQLVTNGRMFDVGAYGSGHEGIKLILDGNLTMIGISDNKNSVLDVAFGATVEMKGNSKITNNTCNSENSTLTHAAPGGVYVYQATLIMDDNAEISNVGNVSRSYIIDRLIQRITVMGGGVFVTGNNPSEINGRLIMRGNSKITNCRVSNTASLTGSFAHGGGVHLAGYSELIMEGNALITNNTASGNAARGGGVYVSSNSTLTQKGSSKAVQNTPDNIYQ